MCEVEFWEVFLKGAKLFFKRGLLPFPRVDCRVAKLEGCCAMALFLTC